MKYKAHSQRHIKKKRNKNVISVIQLIISNTQWTRCAYESIVITYKITSYTYTKITTSHNCRNSTISIHEFTIE